MSGVFISYRREDAKHAAGRLVERLSRTIPANQIFLDVDSIEPGIDFKQMLAVKVQACDVLLALIGPGWLISSDGKGARRLDNPNDFVRIEIEAALARDVRVIPVLIDGAEMPKEEDLPEALRPLAFRHAVRLVHESFGSDSEELAKALTRIADRKPVAQRLSEASVSQRADWKAQLVSRGPLGFRLNLEKSTEKHTLELDLSTGPVRDRLIIDGVEQRFFRWTKYINRKFQLSGHSDRFELQVETYPNPVPGFRSIVLLQNDYTIFVGGSA